MGKNKIICDLVESLIFHKLNLEGV